MKKSKEDNILNFPTHLTNGEREVEAILFAAVEPLEIESIEAKISKNIDVKKTLEKLKKVYAGRGINLVNISNKWSFRANVPNFC